MREEVEQKTYFAKADYRGKERVFGIKAGDRSKHVYVIGKTGMGKTVVLENMAVQDIQNGNGMAFIDPHGEAAATLLDYIPEERIEDVIHFAPFDMAYPISFNIMEDVGYDKRHLVVSGLVSAFKKIWPDVWSARMEYILSNTLFALLEYPDSTILDINRMLINKEFRKDVIAHITDPVVKSFWAEEFANYTDRYTQEATPAIQNKIGQFVSNPLVRNIIGQSRSSFDFRQAMDTKKIIIMNLSKGRMGDTNSKLIGSMLIIKIYLAAMSRADTTVRELTQLPFFYFFVDEFQSFANETFADILSESRKYKLSLTIAHQYIGQMPDEVREAVFGNVGTIVAFRIGAEDAEVFEKEFSPTFYAEDMVNLGLYQIYLKLMIDGLASKPFSASTLSPIVKPARSFKNEAIGYSRKTYAQPRATVEEDILKRHASFLDTPQERSKQDVTREGRRPARAPSGLPANLSARGAQAGALATAGQERTSLGRTDRRQERYGRRAESRQTDYQRADRWQEKQRQDAPRQQIYQPFKKAFEKEPVRDTVKPRTEEPVSLDVLNPKQKQDGGAPNTHALKKALAEALKETTDNKQQTANDKKQAPDALQTKKDEQKNIKEIPEDELKKMLDIDK